MKVLVHFEYIILSKCNTLFIYVNFDFKSNHIIKITSFRKYVYCVLWKMIMLFKAILAYYKKRLNVFKIKVKLICNFK